MYPANGIDLLLSTLRTTIYLYRLAPVKMNDKNGKLIEKILCRNLIKLYSLTRLNNETNNALVKNYPAVNNIS